MERLVKHGVSKQQIGQILKKLRTPGSKIRLETPGHDVVVEILK